MRLTKKSYHINFSGSKKIEDGCGVYDANKKFEKKRKSKQNLGGTVFRCCLPCRGGSAAPATSPPNSPVPSDELNNIISEPQTGTVSSTAEIEATSPLSNQSDQSVNRDDITAAIAAAPSSATSTPPTRLCQSATSPLPHIEEEEEGEGNHLQAPGESRLTTERNCNNVDEYSSSPSPRNKHKIRKQIKGWNRTVALVTTSSETPTSSGSVSASAGCGSGSLISSSSNAGAVTSSQHPGLLLPKMQAEQGSIGDLQKYHSRYLKNRRHTLANVRD